MRQLKESTKITDSPKFGFFVFWTISDFGLLFFLLLDFRNFHIICDNFVSWRPRFSPKTKSKVPQVKKTNGNLLFLRQQSLKAQIAKFGFLFVCNIPKFVFLDFWNIPKFGCLDFWNIPKFGYLDVWIDAARCLQMLPDASRCLADASRCLQIPPDASRCFQMPPRCFQMPPEAFKCFKMLPDACRCLPDASRCLPDASQMP